MKRIVLMIVCFTAFITTYAQNEARFPITVSPDTCNFRLYPTENIYNHLKLDTRNGRIWQVQFSVRDSGSRLEVSINSDKLVFSEDEKVGRFFLFPTQNFYNFLLLDQVDGRVWQVQWGIDDDHRFIRRIYSDY